MKTKIIILCLSLVSWGAFAQHDHAGHDQKKTDQGMVMFKNAQLGKAYNLYIQLKDALVSSDEQKAKSIASELQKSVMGVDNGKMVADEAANVVAAQNLDDQRKAFSGVSNMMAMLVKEGKLSMGMIYLDYCPMVKASWLSNEKEIKNPYLGDKMLTCGSVKEMIH